MKSAAESLGYEYKYKGCICNGSPLNYSKIIGGVLHRLILYIGRDRWRLIKGCDVVLNGTGEDINQKLTQYEISQSSKGAC